MLVPVGSTEQHGPHLPLETDSVVASAVATAVAKRLTGDEMTVRVAPTVAYGSSGEHQSFPGTISIGADALTVVVTELARSLAFWAGRIVFVNGHGGNVPTLSEAIPQMIRENHAVSWLPCIPAGSDAHAGRAETSLMLHLRPDSVDMTVARPGNTASLAELMPSLRARGVRAVSASGVLGDPRGADAGEGRELFAGLVDDACELVTRGVAGHDGRLRTHRARSGA